jgi:hypothetical protein
VLADDDWVPGVGVTGVPLGGPDPFLFGVVKDLKNVHSSSNLTDSNSEARGEYSRSAVSMRGSIFFSINRIINTRPC